MIAPGEMSGGGTSAVIAYLDRERERVEAALSEVSRRALRGIGPPLREPIEYALSTTGKRIRPILCVAATRAATSGLVPDAAYRLACAVEIVHTYSLIHDDLPCMDDDDLRRGRPTVHKVFGVAPAVAAGAALLPMAIEVLVVEGRELGLDATERARLVVELAEAAGADGMVGGQLLDLESEQVSVDGATLEGIHRRKTGALLTAALRIGALAGRGSQLLVDALTAYGRALGLAFQITDDLLDVEGSSAELGKTAGRDVVLRKASYPALYGVEQSRSMARERIAEAKRALAGFDLPDLLAVADYTVERRH